MSQIHYSALSHTHGPVDVQTGWDRLRQCFHVTAWRIGRDEEDDPFLIDSTVARCACLTTFLDALRDADIPVPLQVSYLLLKHAVINAGNVVVRVNVTRSEAPND